MRRFHGMRIERLTLLRENTGTTGWEQTARAAAETLAILTFSPRRGGLAVQEHGYPRLTLDVDIVVPDVLEAVEFLTAVVSGHLHGARSGGPPDRSPQPGED